MGALIGQLTKFITLSSRTGGVLGKLKGAFGGIYGVISTLAVGVVGLAAALGGALVSALGAVADLFLGGIKKAIGFELSINGLMEAAEEARRYWSELADSMNFYSSSTGSTTNAVNMLTTAAGKSTASIDTLRGAFSSMVDAGADSDKFINDMLPLMGDFETKTGLAASQFGQFSTKFQQMFGEKKGITKDIKDLTKALIGTGLKGAQLEQTMQGITEAAEKMGFATRGDTLDIKGLAKEFGKTSAVFKAFGVSAQTTSSFLNGLVDPENVEKNMLLMNKLGVSYGEFNDMLNSGKGHDKFFDKILKNVGSVAQEANMIQDASTRYKYLKDTLNLPPEIANKLMKVSPARMQSELKKIKKEMEEAEKKDKWRKDLKAREEKYEEQMRFLRMQMVAPLIDIVQKNRGTIQKFVKAIVPLMQGLSRMVSKFLSPFIEWLDAFSDGLEKIKSSDSDSILKFAMNSLGPLWASIKKSFSDVWNSNEMQSAIVPFIETIGKHMSAMISYIVHKATGGKWGGKDKTYADILKEKEEENKKEQEENKKSGKLDIGREKRTEALNQNEDIKKKLGGWGHNKDLFAATAMFDLQNKLKTNQPIDQTMLDELKKTNSSFNNVTVDELKKLSESMNKYDQTNSLAIKRFESLNGAETFEQSKKFYEDLAETEKENSRRNQGLNVMRNGGTFNEKDLPAQTKTDVVDAAKNIENKPLSDSEVAAAVQKLMSNQSFVAQVAAATVGEKDKKIAELSSDLDKLKTSNDNLKVEFEALKNESVPGILKQWEQFLFGDSDETIKSILSDIRDATLGDMRLNLQNSKRNKVSSAKNTDIGDVEKQAINVGFNNFAGSDIAGGAKNLQAKQTIYLKGIYTASIQTSKVLTYIGNNLIFTSDGLVVSQPAAGNLKGAALKDINGKLIQPGNTMISGFSII